MCRSKPLSAKIGMQKAPEHDEEGRIITLEYDKFFLVNVYVSLSSGIGILNAPRRKASSDSSGSQILDSAFPVVFMCVKSTLHITLICRRQMPAKG